MIQDAFWGILIPFLGTSLGAGCVFFLKKSLSDGIQRALTGFAAGVMVAASVWSLLIPAMEQSAGMGKWAFVPAAVGFWIGILFLLLLSPGDRCGRGRPAWSLMVRLFPGLPFLGGLVCGSVLGDGRACGGREGQGEKNSKNDPYPEKNGSGGFPDP